MKNSSTEADSMRNNGIIEKYCYNNDTANCTTYGGLSQWREACQYVNSSGRVQGICPSVWHIPTYKEFQACSTSVGGNSKKLLAIGQGSGINTSGFSALLAGFSNNNCSFASISYYTSFWSSWETGASYACSLGLDLIGNIGTYNNYEGYGFSIRCLKD